MLGCRLLNCSTLLLQFLKGEASLKDVCMAQGDIKLILWKTKKSLLSVSRIDQYKRTLPCNCEFESLINAYRDSVLCSWKRHIWQFTLVGCTGCGRNGLRQQYRC